MLVPPQKRPRRKARNILVLEFVGKKSIMYQIL
jgi:hypothetical protein